MRASTFIATLSAAVAVSAQEAGVDWEWSVSNWEAGCAKASCSAVFNIKAEEDRSADPQRPAFDASCVVVEGEAEKPCELQITPSTTMDINAQLIAPAEGAEGPTVQVSVKHGDYENA